MQVDWDEAIKDMGPQKTRSCHTSMNFSILMKVGKDSEESMLTGNMPPQKAPVSCTRGKPRSKEPETRPLTGEVSSDMEFKLGIRSNVWHF